MREDEAHKCQSSRCINVDRIDELGYIRVKRGTKHKSTVGTTVVILWEITQISTIQKSIKAPMLIACEE